MSTLLVLAAVGNLGRKGTIMVVHHTDCGLARVEGGDQEIRSALMKKLSEDGLLERPGEGDLKQIGIDLDGMTFGSFAM
jgi:hypothetical protein